MRKIKIISFVVFALIFIIIGYLLSVLTFKYKVYIEYNTGSMKHEISIWPFTVRNELLKENLFQSYPFSSMGELYLIKNPDWHKAVEFDSFSNNSPTYKGGIILNNAIRLSLLFNNLPKSDASEMKKQFLNILKTEDVGNISKFVSEKEQEMLKHHQGKMTLTPPLNEN